MGLVGCVKSKRSRPARARDLYTSPLFLGRRKYVEQSCDVWFILSAKHGVLTPDAETEPYDMALKDASRHERMRWSRGVEQQLRDHLGAFDDITFEIHAGEAYRVDLVPLLIREGARVDEPAAGLNQGQQLAFYARETPMKPPPTSGSAERADFAIEDIREIGPFRYRWPDSIEEFAHGWQFIAREGGLRHRVKHGVGRRVAYGRERIHTVTWLDDHPTVEGAEAEDHQVSRALISPLKRPDRKDARNLAEVPLGYESFEIVTHRDEISGPNARHGLALKIREDDLRAWARFALLRHRDREARAAGGDDRRPLTQQTPLEPATRPVDPAAIAHALLAHGERLTALASGDFTPDAEADHLVRTDAFAFLVGVICDEQVRFEAAWNAPLELRRRLGHWDLLRIAGQPATVIAAFADGAKLHRWVTKTPERIVAAATKVLDDYNGDAANIWNDRPSAATLRRRLQAFEGIGQKKAAMAVELLEAGLGVEIAELAGSDVAVDVHIRRVFLRSGLSDRDDVDHIVAVARRLHPTRPGALDNPTWDIGRRFCHARDPECAECPLTQVCARLVASGQGVQGA